MNSGCLKRVATSLLGALLLATSVGTTAVASAQVPSELLRRRVVAVRIGGETSGATGARDAGIPIGAPLSRRLLRAAVVRLLETGRWIDVQIDAQPERDGVALTVILTPRIVLTRVDIRGNDALSDDDIRQAISLGRGSDLGDRALPDIRTRIQEVYQLHGYDDASIRVQLVDTDDPTRKVLSVRVEEGRAITIARIRFDGERPPAGIDLQLGMSEGDPLERHRLSESIDRASEALRRAGYLQARLRSPAIERRGPSADVVFPTRVGPRYDVRLNGREPLSREVVEEALQLHEARLTRTSIEAMEARVLDLYRRYGFLHVRVDILRYRGETPSAAVLDVRIRPGHQIDVVGHSFPGANHFDAGYLRDQVLSVLEEGLPDTGLFGSVDSEHFDRLGLSGRSVLPARRESRPPLRVDPTRVFYRPLYEQAMEHLAELYQAQGFLSARSGPARLRELERGRTVVVVPIYEGPRTLLFGVDLRGNEVIGARELLSAAGLTEEEPFSYLGLEEAIARMRDLYQERGHFYANIEPSVRFSEDRQRAEVLLRVIERFEVRVGEIDIEGVERIDENLIREVLHFEEGDLLTPSGISGSRDALMALGVFESVLVTPRDTDVPEQTKAILVRVSEREPNVFDGSFGISTGQGARVAAEYTYLNLLGYALQFSLRGQVGYQFLFQDAELERNITPLSLVDRLERRITIGLALPHLPSVDNVRVALDLVHIRDNERAFGLDKTGAALSFVWTPVSRLQFTWTNEIENNNVQLLGDATRLAELREDVADDPRLTQLLRVPEGDSWVVSSRLRTTLDQRDSPFVPTDGWYTSATAEWVRTLSTEPQDGEPFFSHFLKLSYLINGYIPIGDVVLAAQFRIGGIAHLEARSQTYPNRQYFLGGVDSLRGFNQDRLQPQDIADGIETGALFRGGDFFLLARVELRFPIFESLQGGIFADLGNHWADPANIVLDENFIRPTAGLGLRFVTPVGPLALDVGFNLLRRERLNEPIFAFHLSIGLF